MYYRHGRVSDPAVAGESEGGGAGGGGGGDAPASFYRSSNLVRNKLERIAQLCTSSLFSSWET